MMQRFATETASMFQIKEWQLQRDIEFAQEFGPEFKRKGELWVVDESSFLSQRQKAQVDHMTIKAGAKVIYLGDTLQLQAVQAGKPFEMAQRNGMDTAYMTEISRQKTPELRTAVDMITGRDRVGEDGRLTVELAYNARAFEYLDRAGMVKEIKEGRAIEQERDLQNMTRVFGDRSFYVGTPAGARYRTPAPGCETASGVGWNPAARAPSTHSLVVRVDPDRVTGARVVPVAVLLEADLVLNDCP